MTKQTGASQKTIPDLIVLGAGIFLALLVAIFAYKKYVHVDTTAQNTAPQQPFISKTEREETKIQEKLPEQRDKLTVPALEKLYGRWVVKLKGNALAELTMLPSSFSLIFTNDPQGRFRQYSIGKYNYAADKGIITLSPDQNAQPEKIPGVQYQIMTMRQYAMHIYQKPDDPSIYLVALSKDLAGKTFHPIFLQQEYEDAPVLQFSPLAP